jgi:ABC-type transport system substrate-binding protein
MIGKATTTLAFSISTLNVPELVEVADDLQDEWGNLGIEVTVKVFEGGYLDANVIEPRDYDALLFGEAVGKGLDLAPFWSSSQESAPGLNIALYANKTVDLAVAGMQIATSTSIRNALYEVAANQIQKDIPAIFLYAPETMYLSQQTFHTGPLTAVSNQSDQFNNIYDWSINTEKVWRIFSRWYR